MSHHEVVLGLDFRRDRFNDGRFRSGYSGYDWVLGFEPISFIYSLVPLFYRLGVNNTLFNLFVGMVGAI